MQKTVILLEDDPDIREILEYVLSQANFNVRSYGTAETFIADVTNSGADLFLLDVRLPDGNGMEICGWLKSNEDTANIPIIMMSAHYEEKKSGQLPYQQFIRKPFDIDDVVEQIRKQLTQGNK